MRKTTVLVMTAILFFVSSALVAAKDFSLTSSRVAAGGMLAPEQVFNGFGCSGKNMSPDLSWSGAPAGTKSFAVTVYDPDAPTGSGWWHWLVFNIPSSIISLPADSGNKESGLLPAGAVQSRTDFGQPGYGGACPPEKDGPHHYVFTVWALDVDKLPLDENSSGAMVGFFLNQHQLGKAQLTALYDR